MNTINRRDFVSSGALGAVALGAVRARAAQKAEVWVIEGGDPDALMARCLKLMDEQNGFAPGTGSLALKVNAAWARKPEVGANTHPALVSRFLAGCRERGVREVTVPEHPCNRAEQAFDRSGIRDAVREHNFRMIDLKTRTKSFRKVDVPGGEVLKDVEIAGEYLDADMVVNMPVVKNHSATTMSSALKNWMGVIRQRRIWHVQGLHECIADFARVMSADWTIIDATRVMLAQGPQGPSQDMKRPGRLIVSRDQVAADAVASRFLVKHPGEIGYLRMVAERGLGVMDPERIDVHTLRAA